MSKGAPACTAPAVVLTVLAVPGFTETQSKARAGSVRSTLIAPSRSRSLRYAGRSSIPRSWVSPTPIFCCLGLRCAAHGAHWRPGRASPRATAAWSPPLRAIADHFRRYRHDGGFRMLELQLNRLPHIYLDWTLTPNKRCQISANCAEAARSHRALTEGGEISGVQLKRKSNFH